MTAAARISHAFVAAHPEDAARVLEDIPNDSLARYLEHLEPETAAATLRFMAAETGASCLAHMLPGVAARVAAALDLPVRITLLKRMPGRHRTRLLACWDEELAVQTRRLLALPGEPVGTLANSRVLTLAQDSTVAHALRRLRERRTEVGSHVYCLDGQRRLIGAVSLHSLFRAPRNAQIGSCARRDFPRVSSHAPQATLLDAKLWERSNVLAVMDEDEVFLGVVEFATVARVSAKLEEDRSAGDPLQQAVEVGEICWSALSALVESLAEVGNPPTRAEHLANERPQR